MELLSLLNELKQMKWIDLSHEFGENTPRWPGFESLRKEIKLEFGEYPVRAYQYSFPGQYGTHVDVPGHADVNGRTLEKIDIKECVLPLCVINCSDKVKMNSDYALSLDDIHDYEKIYGKIPKGAFVAMRSDWGKGGLVRKSFKIWMNTENSIILAGL